MSIINCTPHDVVLIGSSPRTFPASGRVIRLEEERGNTVEIDGVPVSYYHIGNDVDFSFVGEGDYIIVSRAVAAFYKLPFLLYPDEQVIEEGRVVGCRRLARYSSARFCNCGSGVPVMECDADSMYCG